MRYIILLAVSLFAFYSHVTADGTSLFANYTNLIGTYYKTIEVDGYVCNYGSNGLLTISTDFGSSWESRSIPTLNNDCVGVCFNAGKMIGFLDDGSIWVFDNANDQWQKSGNFIEKYVTRVIADSTTHLIYVLTNTSVSMYDYNYQRVKSVTLAESIYQEMALDGAHLYLRDTCTVYTFKSADLSPISNYSFRSNLHRADSYLFYDFVVNNKNVLLEYSDSVFVSNDYGATWRYAFLAQGFPFNMLNSKIIRFGYELEFYKNLDILSIIHTRQSEINSDYDVESGQVESLDSSLQLAKVNPQSVTVLSNGTTLCVGDYNQIYMSKDTGRSWKCCSYINSPNGPYFYDSTRGFINDGRVVYFTDDGGVTWIPSKYQYTDSKNIVYGTNVSVIDSNVCWVFALAGSTSDIANVKVYDHRTNELKYYNCSTLNNVSLIYNVQVINIRDTNWIYIPVSNAFGHYWTNRILVDSTFNVTNFYKIDSLRLGNVFRLSSQMMYAYGVKISNIDTANGVFSSGDNGKTWQLVSRFASNGFSVTSEVKVDEVYYILSQALKPNFSGVPNYILSNYNSVSNSSNPYCINDTISLKRGLAVVDSTLYMGGYNKLWFKNAYDSSSSSWRTDALEGDYLYYPVKYNVKSHNILLAINAGKNGTVYGNYWLGLLRNYSSQSASYVVDSKVEEYYSVSNPFPMPGSATISWYYWSDDSESAIQDIGVYDSYGEQVSSRMCSSYVTPVDNMKVKVSCNVEELSPGVYVVVMKTRSGISRVVKISVVH